MRRINRFLFYLNVVVIVFTLLSYLSPITNPNTFWPIAFLGLGYPFLLLLNSVFILFWILIKPRYAIASFVCLALGWNSLYNLYSLPLQQPESIFNKSQLKVISYNISQLNRINFLEPDAKVQKKQNFTQFLNDQDLDVICLQEISKKNVDVIRRLLTKDTYFHHENYTGIISAHPISRSGSIKDEQGSTFAIWCDIKLQEKQYRLYSVYLRSNQITTDTDQLMESGDLQEEKTWQKIKMILQKYRGATRIRANDIFYLKEHTKDSTHPVILAGDFNDVPQSFVFEELASGLYDTFHFSRGMHPTYGGNIPFLRIDYILVDPTLKTGTFSRELVDFSDHYPIIATLAL